MVSGFAIPLLGLLAASNRIGETRAPFLPLAVERLEQPLDDARVGDWVAYRIDAGPTRQGHWRVAVVGEEQDARGRPAASVSDVGRKGDGNLFGWGQSTDCRFRP